MAAHTFQLPHRPSRIERRSQSRDRKRRRSEDYARDVSSELDDEAAIQQSPSLPAVSVTSLTANRAEQYRTVGLLAHEEIPPHPFPHAPHARDDPIKALQPKPKRQSRHGKKGGGVEYSSGKHSTLRQQHMNVMTAIMHRCLLDNDFERAGKAWSLLLRSNPPMDVRRHDQWGIGAEILMRKATQDGPASNDADSDSEIGSDDDRPESPFVPNTSYDDEGLRAARSYYEMLIRRYPGQPAQSTTTRSLPNAIDFNPVLINVWLYQVAFTRKTMMMELRRRQLQHHDGAAGDDADDVDAETGRSHHSDRQSLLEQLRVGELKEAESISAKLDELFRSPVYDRDEALRQLQQMVWTWIEDLKARKHILQTDTNGTTASPTEPQQDDMADQLASTIFTSAISGHPI